MDLLIVDGYNVIHSIDRYRRLRKEDWEKAIEKLLLDLVNLAGMEDFDVKVVFDGRRQGSKKKIGGLEVIYSSKRQSADAVIEKLVFECDGTGNIAVCTADYTQQKVVSRPGVRRMAPRELQELMTEKSEESEQITAKRKRDRIEDRLPDEIRRQLDEMRK